MSPTAKPPGELLAPTLFSPIKCGDMRLQHRIAMAPLTRSRSPGEIAGSWQAEHYGARATPGGLLISEGTWCSPTARAHDAVPGIMTEEQAAGWKKTTEAVHAKGGYIFAQLWHVGMASVPQYQPGNQAPVSASEGNTSAKGKPASRALSVGEIKEIVEEYRIGARRAKEAGFDGVEIHGAHGYLIEQFLHTSTNRRTDQYGGPCENRARFLFEVLDACLLELPPSKVALRLSPDFRNMGVRDADPTALFTHVLTRLQKYPLAYLQFTEPVWGGWRTSPIPHSRSPLIPLLTLVRPPTLIMLTGGYLTPDLSRAEDAVRTRCALVGIGRGFITMPDLVDRLRGGEGLAQWEEFQKFSYGGDQGNYNDFPTAAEVKAAGGDEAKAKRERLERVNREVPLDVVGKVAKPRF
ncbi:12-oxophytodienoate reductase-like protein [Hyaloraphidium curvatum]|nr:12-oxophytodienoate reductase-like protein [Hyaloraphidium curvatum]